MGIFSRIRSRISSKRNSKTTEVTKTSPTISSIKSVDYGTSTKDRVGGTTTITRTTSSSGGGSSSSRGGSSGGGGGSSRTTTTVKSVGTTPPTTKTTTPTTTNVSNQTPGVYSNERARQIAEQIRAQQQSANTTSTITYNVNLNEAAKRTARENNARERFRESNKKNTKVSKALDKVENKVGDVGFYNKNVREAFSIEGFQQPSERIQKVKELVVEESKGRGFNIALPGSRLLLGKEGSEKAGKFSSKVAGVFVPETPGELITTAGLTAGTIAAPPVASIPIQAAFGASGVKGALDKDLTAEERVASGIVVAAALAGVGTEFAPKVRTGESVSIGNKNVGKKMGLAENQRTPLSKTFADELTFWRGNEQIGTNIEINPSPKIARESLKRYNKANEPIVFDTDLSPIYNQQARLRSGADVIKLNEKGFFEIVPSETKNPSPKTNKPLVETQKDPLFNIKIDEAYFRKIAEDKGLINTKPQQQIQIQKPPQQIQIQKAKVKEVPKNNVLQEENIQLFQEKTGVPDFRTQIKTLNFNQVQVQEQGSSQLTIQKQMQQQGVSSVLEESQNFKQGSSQRQSQKQKQSQRLGFAQRERLGFAQRERLGFAQAQPQRLKFGQLQKQMSLQALRFKFAQGQRIRTPTNSLLKLKQDSMKRPPRINKKKKPSKVPRGGKFGVEVRRRGIFQSVGSGLTAKEAQEIGRDITSKTLGATFKITGRGSQKLKTPVGFRKKQTKSGTLFIEKRGLRLSKKGEKVEIQQAKRKKRK